MWLLWAESYKAQLDPSPIKPSTTWVARVVRLLEGPTFPLSRPFAHVGPMNRFLQESLNNSLLETFESFKIYLD